MQENYGDFYLGWGVSFHMAAPTYTLVSPSFPHLRLEVNHQNKLLLWPP